MNLVDDDLDGALTLLDYVWTGQGRGAILSTEVLLFCDSAGW